MLVYCLYSNSLLRLFIGRQLLSCCKLYFPLTSFQQDCENHQWCWIYSEYFLRSKLLILFRVSSTIKTDVFIQSIFYNQKCWIYSELFLQSCNTSTLRGEYDWRYENQFAWSVNITPSWSNNCRTYHRPQHMTSFNHKLLGEKNI